MRNPIRRNRNLGTSKQGHGSNNRLSIPFPSQHKLGEHLFFHERLGRHRTTELTLATVEIPCLVEETQPYSAYACTVEDAWRMLGLLPPELVQALAFVVFRQPKRKERILRPAWGRLVYFYQYQNEIRPAIIMEAQDFRQPLWMSRRMDPERALEFERLQADGHEFVEEKKGWAAELTLEACRNTQLYRTLPHELGHLDHYLRFRAKLEAELQAIGWEEDVAEDSAMERYFSIPSPEKEQYAHRFAEKSLQPLFPTGQLPFERQLNAAFLEKHGLLESDFSLQMGDREDG
ncbi:MAG: hypothetical protein AAF399_21150 [Bacteroidota bacterium]